MLKAVIKQFIDILLKQGKVTQEQYQEFTTKDYANLTEAEKFVRSRIVLSEEEVAQVKAELYSVPYATLIGKGISSDVLNLLPRDLAENYQMVVFDREGKTIKVGMVDASNFKAMEAVDFMGHREDLAVQYFTISNDSYRAALKQYESLREEVGVALETAEDIFGKGDAGDLLGTKQPLEDMIKSAPVTKIISVILRHAIEGKASDIHVEPVANQSRIRYRIDGVLHTTIVLPLYVHAALVSRIKVMANLKIDETRIPQDGRIHLSILKREVDFRVATVPLMNSEKVVMRILATPDKAPTLNDLGYDGLQLKVVERNFKKPHGMFLVTGPTGSGKSTTLFSVLSSLNSEEVNITTLEDPVEYFIAGVNQSSIRPEVGFTFANGLRALLRQDPDVIMVGEIRDSETATLGIQAALTGHLLLSTLHTNDATGAIPRLFDMKVEPFLLASTCNVVIAQRLVRRVCSHCKVDDQMEEELMHRVHREFSRIPEDALYGGITRQTEMKFYKGKGCPRCGHSGYSGRSSVVEVIDITTNMKDLITSGFHRKDVEEELKRQHFITMRQDGILKAMLGITTLEEVLIVSKE